MVGLCFFHPSLSGCHLVGEDGQAICDRANCPLVMLSAGNDFNDVKYEGMLHNAINRLNMAILLCLIPTQ